jgi:peptidoglycan/LPS O-acetylase OafA/YrhL
VDAARATAPHRFVGFDGVRAIAILLVILWHGALWSQFPERAMGPLRPLVMTGWAGVDLFFALSGFLITSLLLREEQRNERAGQGTRFSLGRFYLRRALRILPVFFVVFALDVLVFSAYFPSAQTETVFANHSPLGLWPYLTFWGNYFAHLPQLWGRPITPPGEAFRVFWSLCVEEHFYLLWPLFLTLCKRWRVRVGVAVAACVLMSVGRYVARATNYETHLAIHGLSHFRMDSILWGALGALVIDRLPATPRPRRLFLVLGMAAIALLASTRALSVLPPPTPLGISLGLTLLAVFSTGLLVELVKAPTSGLARALDWAPLQVIGRLSYAMYLIHFPAIDLGRLIFFNKRRAPTLGNLLLSYGLFVFLTITAAAVLHFLVERPFLRLKDRFTGAPGRSAAAPPP